MENKVTSNKLNERKVKNMLSLNKDNKVNKLNISYRIFMWIILIFFLLYTLVPMLWLVVSSFKTNTELMGDPFSLPAKWQIQNYINAFQVSGLATLFMNSIIISLCATLLNIIVAAMASYSIARFNFKGKEAIFNTFTVGILVPINALMVPYFLVVNKIGVYNTRLGLILVYAAVGLPLSISIVRGFMNSIPGELEEAGIVDGCNFFQRFMKIVLPMSRTGLVTAATFQFIYCWNEFIYAMLLTTSQEVRTVQIGIRYFTNQFTTDYVSMYAAIIISIIPSILGYIMFQDKIISGLTAGAVKG
jgi:raffinose/stachyose/melibiose transport system permease protein